MENRTESLQSPSCFTPPLARSKRLLTAYQRNQKSCVYVHAHSDGLYCFVFNTIFGPCCIYIILYCIYILPLSVMVYGSHHSISLFLFVSVES